MMTGINKDILDRIRRIDWLGNAGSCRKNDRFVTVFSWDEVILYASSQKWEQVLDKRRFEYNNSILNRWKWNLMTAIMEDTYSSCALPVTFFSELLELYEDGYFPCGWRGDTWPDGKLVIF